MSTTDAPYPSAPPPAEQGEVAAPPTPVPKITIPHGPAQYAALAFFLASFLAALATGITTFVGALPAGVSPNIGAWGTAISGVLSAVALGIYVVARWLNAQLHTELPEAP
jgi:hypothetical protein